ncbi:MAG: hypothetical protein JWR16_1108 [Nevskia sp.]|nr:hypothetical protein [Nevskia sp.]
MSIRNRSAAKGGFLLACLLAVLALAGCGGGGGGDNGPSGPKATSIEVTPTNPSIADGTTQQFTAMALFDDGSKQDVTTTVTWSSDKASIATISNAAPTQGLAQGLAVGSATITAAYSAAGVSLQGTTQLTVTSAVITGVAITAPKLSLAKGTSVQFAATATFSDGSHQDVTAAASWSAATPAIATVSTTAPTKGLAQAVAVGSTAITASYLGQNGSATLTVTAATLTALTVTPATVSLPLGTTQQFTATGTYTDGSQQNLSTTVAWTSSDSKIATIANGAPSGGLAQTVAQGTATITATTGGASATAKLTVTPVALSSISVTPPNPTVAKSTNRQFTATGLYTDSTTKDLTTTVTWSSSDSSIASISNASGSQGLAAALNTGKATITATSGSIKGSTLLTVSTATLTSIGVTPATPKLAAGYKLQFVATGTYSDSTMADITTQVTWSSTTAAATISNASGSNGLATGASAGTSTIVAQLGAIQGSSDLTVTSATLTSIAVTPATVTLPNGRTQQFTATGTFSDANTLDLTQQVAWTSSDTTLATVSATGLAKAVAAAGTPTIKAASGATTGTATVTLSPADLVSLTVTPGTASIAKGLTQQFSALGQLSDGTSRDFTADVAWTSSDTTVATISNDTAAASNGAATAAGVGSTTISAKANDAAGHTVSSTASLSVTAAALTAIKVTPSVKTLALGQSQQFTATGTYTDGSMPNLTTQVSWTSSAPSVATISNAAGSKGLASTGGATGTTGSSTISASLGGVSSGDGSGAGNALLTVSPATLAKIVVTPANSTLANKSSKQFTATGTDTNGNSTDLTQQVTWTSSDTSLVDINNTNLKGNASAKAATGMVTITAIDPTTSVSGATSLTLTAAVITGLKIEQDSNSAKPNLVPQGYSAQFHATATYADASTADVTNDVDWSSFNTDKLTISNAAGSKGLAHGQAVGSATITATASPTVNANLVVTVDNETLTTIIVGPAGATINGPGNTLQFSATGSFSDGQVLDLTQQVVWSSANTRIASIDDAGLATSGTVLVNRTVTISASQAGLTGTDTLTVTPR